MSLFLPEHAAYTGELEVLDIGFTEEELEEFSATTFFFERTGCTAPSSSIPPFCAQGRFWKNTSGSRQQRKNGGRYFGGSSRLSYGLWFGDLLDS